MIKPETPLVALVGFKRHKWAMAGGVRVMTARDGRVRLLGKGDRVDLDAEVAALTAGLTKSRVVHLRTDSAFMIIYGFTSLTTVPAELKQIVIRECEGAELIGPAPGGALGFFTPTEPLKGAKVSRQLVEALHLRGVGAG